MGVGIIEINIPAGASEVLLKTAGKYCDKDIRVNTHFRKESGVLTIPKGSDAVGSTENEVNLSVSCTCNGEELQASIVSDVVTDEKVLTGALNVILPCSSGAKLLVFEADETTCDAVMATDGTSKWIIGFTGQGLSAFTLGITEETPNGQMRGRLTYTKEFYGNVSVSDATMKCWNDNRFKFNVYAIKAGAYRWTAYYWDE